MLVAVVSDTHVPMRARSMPLEAWRAIGGADLVLHAGDVCVPDLLEGLALIAPVHVVMGNCDPPEVRAWGARDTVELTVEGVNVAMVHDAGPRDGRAARMRRRFPDARVVVYGHSHLPAVEPGGDLLLVNPGSPTDRRRAPTFTVALLRISDGRPEAELVQFG